MVEKKSYVGGAQGRWPLRFSWGRDSFLESKEYQLGGEDLPRFTTFIVCFLFFGDHSLDMYSSMFFLISGACVEFVNDVCWFLDPWPTSDVSSFIARGVEWCELFLAKECRRVLSWPLFHGSNTSTQGSSPYLYGSPPKVMNTSVVIGRRRWLKIGWDTQKYRAVVTPKTLQATAEVYLIGNCWILGLVHDSSCFLLWCGNL